MELADTTNVAENVKNTYMILISLRWLQGQQAFDKHYIFSDDILDYTCDLPNRLKQYATDYNTFMHGVVEECKQTYPDVFNVDFDYTFSLDSEVIKIIRSIPDQFFVRSSSKGERFCNDTLGYMYENFQVDERVISNLKTYRDGAKYSGEDLRLKTQIFTPGWVSETIVNNSLLDMQLDIDDKNKLEYQLEQYKLCMMRSPKYQTSTNNIEGITILEPSCGAGNILNHAWDQQEAYLIQNSTLNNKHIANAIMNNMYGIDIDNNAVKLARLQLQQKANRLSFGSDFDKYELFETNIHVADCEYGTLNKDVFAILGMPEKYDIIVGNPPYGGNKHFTKDMRAYFKKHYPDTSTNLYTMFWDKCLNGLKPNGYVAMITPHNWYFLSSDEKLRTRVIEDYTLKKIFDFGAGVFDLSGAVVSTSITVIQNAKYKDNIVQALRLVDVAPASKKYKMWECLYPDNLWWGDGGILKLTNRDKELIDERPDYIKANDPLPQSTSHIQQKNISKQLNMFGILHKDK